MKPSSFPPLISKIPQMPTTWSSLMEGIQIEIYECLLVDLKHPVRVALTLGLTTDELHSVQNLCRRRKEFPATYEQIWAQYSSTGDHAGYIDRPVLEELMPHLLFASACNWRENATKSDLERTLTYLKKVGIPIIPLIQILAAQLRNKYHEAEARRSPNPSPDPLSEVEKRVKKTVHNFIFDLEKTNNKDQVLNVSNDDGIRKESIEEGKDVHAEAKNFSLNHLELGEGGKFAAANHKDTVSQLPNETDTQLSQSRKFRSNTISTDSTLSIEFRYIDAGPVVVAPELDIAQGLPNNPWSKEENRNELADRGSNAPSISLTSN